MGDRCELLGLNFLKFLFGVKSIVWLVHLILRFFDFISIFFGRLQFFRTACIVLPHMPDKIRRVCRMAANASHIGINKPLFLIPLISPLVKISR